MLCAGMYAPYPLLDRKLVAARAILPFLAYGNFALASQKLQLFEDGNQAWPSQSTHI